MFLQRFPYVAFAHLNLLAFRFVQGISLQTYCDGVTSSAMSYTSPHLACEFSSESFGSSWKGQRAECSPRKENTPVKDLQSIVVDIGRLCDAVTSALGAQALMVPLRVAPRALAN